MGDSLNGYMVNQIRQRRSHRLRRFHRLGRLPNEAKRQIGSLFFASLRLCVRHPLSARKQLRTRATSLQPFLRNEPILWVVK
jgi:hypothetical protein